MCACAHSNPACDTDLMWFSMCKICHLVMNLGLLRSIVGTTIYVLGERSHYNFMFLACPIVEV